MYRISNTERETIIRYDQTSEPVNICTYDPSLIRKLFAFSDRYPKLCECVEQTDQGMVTFCIEKKAFSTRLNAPFNEERQRAARERARRMNEQREYQRSIENNVDRNIEA